MARIRCRACGSGYRYEGDCCPNCGAFNRKPKRGYIGADGAYHAVDEKVCFEKKVCYEDQAEKVWKSSPDRKPERRSTSVKRPGGVKRPNTKITSGQASEVIDRFTRNAGESAKKFASQFLGDDDDGGAEENFARSFREKTASFTSKRRNTRRSDSGDGSKANKVWALVGLVVAILGFAINIMEEVDFSPRREPAYPEPMDTVQVAPDREMYYNDYGGTFHLDDGTQFTAFTVEVTVNDDGVIAVSTYCDGDYARFTPVLTDEWTGITYTHDGMVEWQENNYNMSFRTETHDPNYYWYTFSYVDAETGDSYRIAEVGSDDAWFYGDMVLTEDYGAFRSTPLPDGETLYTSVLMDYDGEDLLTVYVLCDFEDLHDRFVPYLRDRGTGRYELVEAIDDGTGGYQYTFDVTGVETDTVLVFQYLDMDYDVLLDIMSYTVPSDDAGDDISVSSDGFVYVGADSIAFSGTMTYDGSNTVEVTIALSEDAVDRSLEPELLDRGTDIRWGADVIVENPAEGEYYYVFHIQDYTGASPLVFCYFSNYTGNSYEVMDLTA